MTIYKARKVSFAYYLIAAVLLMVCLGLSPRGVWRYLLYAAVVVFAVLGFRTATKYSRCPKCGRVQQIGLYKITQCANCAHPIDANTTYSI